MAESLALAVLENLVHMSRADFPKNYVRITALIPEDLLILSAREGMDPRLVGDRWFASRASAVLSVGSAVTTAEKNYLLNPTHTDFARIVVEPAQDFTFDPRLFA